MQNNRRGAGPAARANGARIDSSNGIAMATAVPRRKRRREIGRRVEVKGVGNAGSVCTFIAGASSVATTIVHNVVLKYPLYCPIR
jgi:hypothetical protein